MTNRTEAACLHSLAFFAAIEAAQEANRAGDDDQEQLAAAIVAYCRFCDLGNVRALERATLSPSAAGIAEIHFSRVG